MSVIMVFSDKDKNLIKNLYQLKVYKVTKLINKFPNKWWIKISINRMLKKLRDRHRLTGSGRQRSAALKKVSTRLTIWLGVKKYATTHKTIHEISHRTDIQLRCEKLSTTSLVAAYY